MNQLVSDQIGAEKESVRKQLQLMDFLLVYSFDDLRDPDHSSEVGSTFQPEVPFLYTNWLNASGSHGTPCLCLPAPL